MLPESSSFTIFPKAVKNERPLDVYKSTYEQLSIPRKEVYVSSPLSGGPVRKYLSERQWDKNAHELTPQIFQINSSFAETIASHAHFTTHIKPTAPWIDSTMYKKEEGKSLLILREME